MKHSFSSKAIVLSRETFGESDCYVHFLTKEWGVISVLAKAAKKSQRRYVGGLDLFCHDEIFLRGDPKERPYLVELTVLNSFAGIRDNLERLMTAGRVLQWIKRLTNITIPMPQIYTLMGQTLALIEKETDPDRLDLLTLVFKVKLLGQLGLKPRLDSCAQCENPVSDNGFFDLSAGGVLCKDCRYKAHGVETTLIDSEDQFFLHHAEVLRFTQWSETRLSQRKIHALTRLMSQFASFHTHMRLP